ncbi:IS3 family transposase [Saccharicrinis aurantiacus]|uniref:IS3 family transposase n=1 Tax=Saccharicrinis aurantiacus TaxID=1849719 RepID=UPI00094FC60B|nr:IS3 family transposase [Saccharicrinis aurantiacus]
MYPKVSKKDMCGLFGYTRQSWYDTKKRQSATQLSEVLLLQEVKKVRNNHKKMGCEKMHGVMQPFLQDHGIKMGRDKFYFLLKEHGLQVRQKRHIARTTNSNHLYKRYPNIASDIELLSSGRLWVSDITYIRTIYGFVYLSLITDAYSRKIVGWSLWRDLTSTGALNALKMAVECETITDKLIHHSDRGIQYCCYDYVNYLKGSNIGISMTENGDPYENAIAERVNGILKKEYDLYDTFNDYNEALEAVKIAIDKYNNQRPHRSCNMLTPAIAHTKTGVLKKRWNKKKANTPTSEMQT